MGFIKEFREFALKGNVIDLAVAVVIGAAFTAIISSLVDDVITPLLLKPALEAANVKDLDTLQILPSYLAGRTARAAQGKNGGSHQTLEVQQKGF